MKNLFLLITVTLFLFACSKETVKIEVSNDSSIDRSEEMVTVSWESLNGKILNAKKIVVQDESGKQVPYQLIYKKGDTESVGSIIFPVTLTAGEKAVFSISEGEPGEFTPRTYARYVPERKDDFAWENDKIAFRMYGPALAAENPSNGVDVWLKRTSDLIVDKFYKDELENSISYHIDHGQGLDCYKVGHTLGAGGIAPYFKDSAWVGNHYSSYEFIENGPLRSTFQLAYDTVKVDGKTLKAKILISLDAGSQLNKAVVTYEGDAEVPQVAAGIFLHKVFGNIKTDKEAGYIAYAEDAVSDAGVPSGRNYIAVVFPQAIKNTRQQNENLLAIADYTKSSEFTYYFGAGWSKWGFETDEDWFNYVADFTQRLHAPLGVKVQ